MSMNSIQRARSTSYATDSVLSAASLCRCQSLKTITVLLPCGSTVVDM
jgi:hypothetical protein